MGLFLFCNKISYGQFIKQVSQKGQQLSELCLAARHAWTKQKCSFLLKPDNLTTISCELHHGQLLAYPCIRDMLILVCSDTFYQLQKVALFSSVYHFFSAEFR